MQEGIIDAHVHVWSPNTQKYPLSPGFGRDDLWRPHFTPSDHFEYSLPSGVTRLNLVQMTWYGLDHSYIIDLIASDPNIFVGTGVVPAITDVSLPQPGKTMISLSQHGIYAFRLRGATTRMKTLNLKRWLDHPTYTEMFTVGATHNLALSFLITPDDLPELDRMCTLFPDTPVILDHLGGINVMLKRNGSITKEHLQNLFAMSKHPKVMIKIGPLHHIGDKNNHLLDVIPLIRKIVEEFGPTKCMWESDSGGPNWMKNPSKEINMSISLIRDHADFLSSSDKNHILYKTAENFFFRR